MGVEHLILPLILTTISTAGTAQDPPFRYLESRYVVAVALKFPKDLLSALLAERSCHLPNLRGSFLSSGLRRVSRLLMTLEIIHVRLV